MEDKDLDAPKPQQTGITMRLGPDSKMSLPIAGGNLVMMLVIAGQLLFKFVDLPDDVTAIRDDMSMIQTDIASLRAQDSQQDKSIGSLETRVSLLEKTRDEHEASISNLESEISSLEVSVEAVESENEKLVACARRPSTRCRL